MSDDAFWYITKSYKQSCLGIGTKQEQISFWKWERVVLMFRMYLKVHHWLGSASADIENCAWIFITFFNISSFTAHIQRFWTQITNSAVFAEIFNSQKWVLLPSWMPLIHCSSPRPLHSRRICSTVSIPTSPHTRHPTSPPTNLLLYPNFSVLLQHLYSSTEL